MARLSVTLSKEKVGQVLTVSGAIIEGTSKTMAAVLPQLEVRCCFDLSRVAQINSCGIAEWIEFLDEIEDGRLLSFRACSPVIVNTLNLVGGFVRQWPVLSLQLPYRCEACRIEILTTMAKEDVIEKSKNDPAALEQTSCSKCGGKACALVIMEDYLSFLEGVA